MTAVFDDEGNITTFVGDTILFDIHDVPTDLNYTIYFRVYDKNNNTVIPETAVNADYQDTVTIEISPSTTDFVSIPSGKKSVTHYYGIKACNAENNVEHTQTVDGIDVSQETKITFMRKRVEGIIIEPTPEPEPTEETTPTEATEPTESVEPDDDNDTDTDASSLEDIGGE